MVSCETGIKDKILEDIRPWGQFKRYAHNDNCSVKILTVNQGQRLSKQVHKKRDELWIVLDEGLEIELEEEILKPKFGDEIVILRNSLHRLSAPRKKGRVLEVAFGFYDEDDIERLEDDYDRK
jgi:mannose-6-phosphate isomerase